MQIDEKGWYGTESEKNDMEQSCPRRKGNPGNLIIEKGSIDIIAMA